MLTEDEISRYEKAGRIVSEIRKDLLKKIKPGDSLFGIAEEIENRISEGGAKPAFPVNISVNEVAAHYTPKINDDMVVGKGDLVKIDIGAHIEGYIADMAFTYSSEKNPLVDASRKALDAGISAIKPGAKVSEISQAIYDEITGSGFGPVVNLTGHSLGRYQFHGTFSIPNVPNKNERVLEDGDVIALEPFVCSTAAHVDESEPVEIFQFVRRKPVRSREGRKIMDLAEKEFSSLPFARRWLSGHVSPLRIKMALMELERSGSISGYPVLKDMEGRKIAQSEDTIIVNEKPVVTTRL